MSFPSRRAVGLIGGTFVLGAAVFMGGCAANNDANASGTGIGHADTEAASLRTALDSLLREHIHLVTSETNAALAGRNEEYNAASTALDANSQELAAVLGHAYNKDVQDKFLDLWRTHIGYIVDYTTAVAKNDEAGKTAAVKNLIAFSGDFGNYIEVITGGKLLANAVTDLAKNDIAAIQSVINAQAAKDFTGAYNKERDAAKQIDIVGNALADAIVEQYPDKY